MPYNRKYNRCVCYVLYAEALQLVKIGYTGRYDERVKGISNTYLTPVELWAVYQDNWDKDYERTLHKRLEDYRRPLCALEFSRNMEGYVSPEWYAVDKQTVIEATHDFTRVDFPLFSYSSKFAQKFEYTRMTTRDRLKLINPLNANSRYI